ncbi:MAG: DUF1844 domain-containing protein [Thermoguttaceae bacterium]
MPDEKNQGEKKIIIDEDWKSQVEAEKEAAQHPAEQGQPTPEKETAESLPPPSLGFLAGTLYLQGAMALGLVPNPITNKAAVHLPQARHSIDLLLMLKEKTEGNRTQEETVEIENMVHQLRMAYIAVSEK